MKAAVIYWSGTGNTEQMANAIAEGAGDRKSTRLNSSHQI